MKPSMLLPEKLTEEGLKELEDNPAVEKNCCK